MGTYLQPNSVSAAKKVQSGREGIKWEVLIQGQLKFNVKGAAKGCSGATGIGVILRNEKGEIKVTFSKSISCADSTLAKTLAVG